MFAENIIKEAMAHAKAEFPKEACGLVLEREYRPCLNISPNPEHEFEIATADYKDPLTSGSLKAVIHSHTSGIPGPGSLDMKTQMEFNVPFGITFCNPEPVRPYFWGPGVDIPPLLQRQFRHGPSGTDGRGDCYAAIKDWYKLERNIDLPEFPRDYEEWLAGVSGYLDNFSKAGFKCVFEGPNYSGKELPVGSLILFRLVGKVPHHGAVYLGKEQIFHHLGDSVKKTRLSKKDPLSRFRQFATHWLVYEP